MDQALAYRKPYVAALVPAPAPSITKPCEARVRALWSGLSRGTERLIYEGRVPESEWSRMRAPFQRGDFPFPVVYGYSMVGLVEEGPQDLVGKTVFALYPHQSRFVLPVEALTVLPDDLPPRRATLAANMETALNAVWDSGPPRRRIPQPTPAPDFITSRPSLPLTPPPLALRPAAGQGARPAAR